ncbi:MAG: dihydrolipoamide acetyltransferase family protein, partial [Nanoarchaeota archaeon]|nr:dihydrolipoamide acetyltransferase family protein [Nanoarchaeota archaeon]
MDFKFPDLGEGIAEGKIVKWLVKQGDTIKKDQPVCQAETDKAVVDIPSPYAGKITKILFKENEVVHVGKVIFTIDTGDGLPPVDTNQGIVGQTSAAAQEISFRRTETVAPSASAEVKATPGVRKLARDLNVDLLKVRASGKDGRISEDDVKTAASGKPLSVQAVLSSLKPGGPEERVPLAGIRAAIAKNMMRSLQSTAQVSHFDRADVTALMQLREKQKKDAESKGIKLTVLAYIVKAISQVLKNHPALNASIDGETLVYKKYCNIGVAIDTEAGLLVPNIKDADKKSVFDIAKAIKDFADRAKDRKLKPEEMQQGTFTITNVGSIGGTYVTPVINYPESAIIGLGRMQPEPVVKDNKVTIATMLYLSLTYDHRIVDGAPAARFMQEL